MKDKIMYLILGILIGAVITSGCFLVFQKNSKMPDDFKGGMEFRGERPDDEDFKNKIKNGEIPEKPQELQQEDNINN